MAEVGYEYDAVSISDTVTCMDAALSNFVGMHSEGFHRFGRDTSVRRCFGCLDLERSARYELLNPVHQLFCAFGIQLVELLSSAYRDKEEQTPSHQGETVNQLENGGKIRSRLVGNERVDLEGKSNFTSPLRGLKGDIKCARHLTDVIVQRSSGSIQA